MKTKKLKWLEVAVETVNYVIISYALSNMSFLFKTNPLYILFFASEIWLASGYWKRAHEATGSKVLAALLLAGGFAAQAGMLYFWGHVSGELIPF